MIADALKEKGMDLDKRIIDLEEPIKALGIYTVNVKLHPGVTGKVKVWVVRE
jgi:large subunit ribosomal protein L9